MLRDLDILAASSLEVTTHSHHDSDPELENSPLGQSSNNSVQWGLQPQFP